MAVLYQQTEAVRFLLDQGAHPDDDSYKLCLYPLVLKRINDEYVCRCSSVDIGRLLLNAGCEVPAISRYYLAMCVESVEYYEDNVSLLLYHEKSSLNASEISESIPFFMFITFCESSFSDVAHFQRLLDEFDRMAARFKLDWQTCGFRWRWISLHLELRWGRPPSPYFNRFLRYFLERGVNPCVIGSFGCTPTILIMRCNLISEWVWALEAANINVELVMLNALRTISEKTMIVVQRDFLPPDRLSFWTERFASHYEEIYRKKFEKTMLSVPILRRYLLFEFAELGYHIHFDETDDPNVYELSASGVDYAPSTTYDPQRAEMEMRKRKPTAAS